MPFTLTSDAARSTADGSLRSAVEKGMVAVIAIVALLLVLLALPDFGADHIAFSSPLVLVSWFFAALLVVALPCSIVGRREPARGWLWVSVAAYVALLVLEPFELRDPLPLGSTPWLLALSLIAFSSAAVVEPDPVRAGIVCGGLDIALAVAYGGRIPVGHSVIDAIGLGLLAAALITGARILRARARRADLSEQAAQLLFENQHRELAIESERVHTDALLHDSLLATLLAAAGNEAPERTTEMARSALGIISDTDDHPVMRPTVVSFGDALRAAEQDLAPLRPHARIDTAAAHDIELPADVADALVSATVQALTNSVRHAGVVSARTAVALPLDGGGVRLRISDDGIGFDPAAIGRERLGVRVSILERVRIAGASAEIRSVLGAGTTVALEWRPACAEATRNPRPAPLRINLIPRRQLSRVLAVLILVAILTAVSEAALFSRAVGPLIAAVLGLSILPALLRGARSGSMSRRTSWIIAGVGLLLCCTATIGLDPATVDCVSIYWYTCGLLAGAVMVWMTGNRAPPIVTVAFQIAQVTAWAGPTGAIRLGLAAETVLVIAGLMMHRAIRRISTAADISARRQRELTTRQAEWDAFHSERQQRLRRAGTSAAPLLEQIIAARGDLDARARAECRVLEQALRDEIRGRGLLNESIRDVVSTHRRRGAQVQVLDDGGLEGLAPDLLDGLLNDAALQLTPLLSSRIVIRSGHPESGTAITIVASTPDETAAALGMDTDDEIDLWVTIPRPAVVGLAA